MSKDPNAQALGAKGGRARAARLSADDRKVAAQKAAAARWKDHTPSAKPSAKSKRKARQTY